MTTTKYREVKIPVKPYLLKYARKLYGSIIRADSTTALGAYVRLCLEKNIYANRHVKDQVGYNDLTEQLTVLINIWQFDRLGFDISHDNIISINKFLENSFDEALYLYCLDNINKGQVRYVGLKDAYYAFAALYHIEMDKDITFEAIKKKQYRYSQKRNPPPSATPVMAYLFQ